MHFVLLAEKMSKLGALIFLASFCILFISGLGLIMWLLLSQLSRYFSSNSRLERKLLFCLNRWEQQIRIFEFKKAKLLYLTQKKRKLLLKKWGDA